MRVDLTKLQVGAVAAMLRDVLTEDERLYLDMLEAETDIHELIRHLLNQIEQDEGIQAALAEQINDRLARKARAAERVKHNRDAIAALLECAGLDKLTLPEATVSVRKVPPKPIVTNPEAVPDEFCTFTKKPNMAAIKQADILPLGVTLDNGCISLTVRRK